MSFLGAFAGGAGAAAGGALMSSIFGGGSSASARRLANAQKNLLNDLRQLYSQYGDPALESLYQWATHPYQTAAERSAWSGGAEDINKAYRPVYTRGLVDLSRRGMLSSANSNLDRFAGGMERARAGSVAQWYMQQRAKQAQEGPRRMAMVLDALNARAGGQIGLANAYSPLVGMYGNMAAGAGQGAGDFVSQYLRWQELQRQRQYGNTATGPTVSTPTGSSGYQIYSPTFNAPLTYGGQ